MSQQCYNGLFRQKSSLGIVPDNITLTEGILTYLLTTNYPVLLNYLLAVYLPVNVLHHTLMRFHSKKGLKHPPLTYPFTHLLTTLYYLLTFLLAVYLPACSLVTYLLFKLLCLIFKPLPYMA